MRYTDSRKEPTEARSTTVNLHFTPHSTTAYMLNGPLCVHVCVGANAGCGGAIWISQRRTLAA